MTTPRWAYACALGLAVALGAVAARAADQPGAGEGAKPAETRRDAAEVVKEGDMSQWLQYYQRERGDGWSKAPPGQSSDKPTSDPQAPGATVREAQSPDTKQR